MYIIFKQKVSEKRLRENHVYKTDYFQNRIGDNFCIKLSKISDKTANTPYTFLFSKRKVSYIDMKSIFCNIIFRKGK